jgi:hypothetical protein
LRKGSEGKTYDPHQHKTAEPIPTNHKVASISNWKDRKRQAKDDSDPGKNLSFTVLEDG